MVATFYILGAFAAFALGQIEEQMPETLPRVIELHDGKAIVGYIDQDNWQSEPMVVVRLDEPWTTGRRTQSIVPANVQDKGPEARNEWLRRHKEGWANAGYVNLGTDRDAYYVLKADFELAQRANELAGAEVEAVVAVPVTEESSSESAVVEAGAPEMPSAAMLWWPHVAIVAGALALGGVAVWFGFLREA